MSEHSEKPSILEFHSSDDEVITLGTRGSIIIRDCKNLRKVVIPQDNSKLKNMESLLIERCVNLEEIEGDILASMVSIRDCEKLDTLPKIVAKKVSIYECPARNIAGIQAYYVWIDWCKVTDISRVKAKILKLQADNLWD